MSLCDTVLVEEDRVGFQHALTPPCSLDMHTPHFINMVGKFQGLLKQ